MKKTLFTLASVLFCAITFAQSVPQGINYQAVARDASGNEITNQSLSVRFSIHAGAANGTIDWQETHTVNTNDYGLFTAVIGQGTATSFTGILSAFDDISWGSNNYFLRVEIDYGNGYVDMGSTQFMSVPYSLYGKDEDSDPSNEIQTLSISGDTLFISGGNYVVIPGLSFSNNLIINGCTDSTACNFDSLANTDDGSCTYFGCTDSTACNYDPSATCDDGSCLTVYGCTNSIACNYDSAATCDDNSCILPESTPYFEDFDASMGTMVFDNTTMSGSTPIGPYSTGWKRNIGSTPSYNTGPSDDMTGGGHYVYMEVSSPALSLETAIVATQCVDVSSLSNPRLGFNYHMYGADMGTLEVLVNGSLVWSLSGDQGNLWYSTDIDLSSYAIQSNGNYVTIVFKGTRGIGYFGDMAIDNVRVSDDVYGCTDSTAFNYDSAATINDLSCIAIVTGCTDSTACNFNAQANTDDGSCLTVYGCTDSAACNFNPNATCDDGSCLTVYGCTDSTMFNYNSAATCDDGSCIPIVLGCTDPNAFNYNAAANTLGSSPLLTTLAGGNGSAGNMFNITNTSNTTVNITGFSQGPGLGNASISNAQVNVYMMPAAYVANSSSWTQVGSATTSLTPSAATGYCPVSGVSIPAGATYGFYVGIAVGSVQYTNGTGTPGVTPLAYDNNITVSEGLGGPWPNPTYAPRNWNGMVHYTGGQVCQPVVNGCTNSTACNYDPTANTDDGSCILPDGCTDPTACNYDPNATCNDGSCTGVSGCTDPTAFNYDASATCDDGSCVATTTNFSYTGSSQMFIIPNNVNSISANVVGASGGDVNYNINSTWPYSHTWIGGEGGSVTATLSVQPGDTLYIYVGGQGYSPPASSSSYTSYTGGWNGGGTSRGSAGSGGGSSDIRLNGTALTDRIIVAGAGGGADQSHVTLSNGVYVNQHTSYGNNNGADGGGLIGGTGPDSWANAYTYGHGGTQTAGGAGGHYGYSHTTSGAGGFGYGGSASGGDVAGGGSGWYGGGSGKAGGGGSSYVNTNISNFYFHSQGGNIGHGYISITLQ